MILRKPNKCEARGRDKKDHLHVTALPRARESGSPPRLLNRVREAIEQNNFVRSTTTAILNRVSRYTFMHVRVCMSAG